MPLEATQKQALDEQGYVVLPGLMDDELLAALRHRVEDLFAEEGDNAGGEFKKEPGCRRLANLMNKGPLFERVLTTPMLLEGVAHVLGPQFKLSSMNVRSVNPYGEGQPFHADMGAVADERGYWVCNTIWLLDDYTPTNGALRFIPQSHRFGRLPQAELPDLMAPHPDEVLLTAKAGDVMIMNAHAWHAGAANRTAQPRTSLHAFFARRDRPQQQYQKALIRPEVQARFSDQVRWLLALDDPHNDMVSLAPEVRSGFLK